MSDWKLHDFLRACRCGMSDRGHIFRAIVGTQFCRGLIAQQLFQLVPRFLRERVRRVALRRIGQLVYRSAEEAEMLPVSPAAGAEQIVEAHFAAHQSRERAVLRLGDQPRHVVARKHQLRVERGDGFSKPVGAGHCAVG